MNNKSKFVALLMCLSCIACLVFTASCNNEEFDTDQMSSGKITLQVYGPRPALRGGELRFVGTNMDKVTGVVFPVANETGAIVGTFEATNFTKKEKTEIRVIIPMNAGVGRIILKTPEGDITTDSDMSYEEPIEIASITTTLVKAGGEFKIEGEFLYLIAQVIFQDGAIVEQEDFVSQTRNEIVVIVPINARSGEIIISNGAEIPIEVGSGELRASIVEPVLTAFTPTTVKAGNQLTITGVDFELVEKVTFAGDKVVETFEVNDEKTSITVTVPTDAQDGAIILNTFSGVEVQSATELTLSLPTINSISPDPVRNGELLTVSGSDLDLVDRLTFSGGVEGEIEDGRTATQLVIRVPINAIDGVLTFYTLAGKNVQSAELELIKPVVTGSSSPTVTAGSEVTLFGENLDLVVSITFPDDLVVEVEPESATSLTVTVPATAVAGALVLTMENGETVEYSGLMIDAPVFAFIPVLPDADEISIHAGAIFIVEIINENRLIEIQVDGATTQHILNGTTLYILVPNYANGNTEFTLVSSNGTITYTLPVIGSSSIEMVIWQGLHEIGWGGGALALQASHFENVPAGAVLTLHFQQKPDTWSQVQMLDGGWAAMNFAELDGGNTFVPTNIGGWNNLEYTQQEFVLTRQILDIILNNQADEGEWLGSGIIMQGSDLIFTRAVLNYERPIGTTLWSGSLGPIGWGGGDVAPINASLLAPGKTIGIEFECDPDTWGWQLRIMSGTWWLGFENLVEEYGDGDPAYEIEFDTSETRFEFVITQEDIDNIVMQAGDDGTVILFAGNGAGLTIYRVYIR